MSERSTIDRVLMLGGKPSAEKSWVRADILAPSLHGWMGYEQKNFMNAGVQPVPLHVRQPQIAVWQDWRDDLMTYSDFLLATNAEHTALIGQSAGATALLWLMQDYPGFAVEKFIMVDPWKPGAARKHTEFRRTSKDLGEDLSVFRHIGELILVISSDDDADQPEVAAYTDELIQQLAEASKLAAEETNRKGLEDEPIQTATLTVVDMLGRGHFVGMDKFLQIVDIVTAPRGGLGSVLMEKYGASLQPDGAYQLAA